jgi:hypothetical protein
MLFFLFLMTRSLPLIERRAPITAKRENNKQFSLFFGRGFVFQLCAACLLCLIIHRRSNKKKKNFYIL